MSTWALKCRPSEASEANIEDEPHTGRQVSVTDQKHQKEVDELIQNDRCITQQHIAIETGKEQVGHITLLHNWAIIKPVHGGCHANSQK